MINLNIHSWFKKKKTLANSGIKGSLLNLVKYTYRKSTDYFKLYGQLLKTLILKSGTSEGLFFDFELEMYWPVPYGWEGERIYNSHYLQVIGLFT